jgi:hypothetical protein
MLCKEFDMRTRNEFPSGLQLVPIPVLSGTRRSAQRAIQSAASLAACGSRGPFMQNSTQHLIRSLHYALAIGAALLCSYCILQGRW